MMHSASVKLSLTSNKKWQIYNCFLSPSKKEMMKISRKGVEKYCSEIVEFIGYLP
jgi:hypothetical protein